MSLLSSNSHIGGDKPLINELTTRLFQRKPSDYSIKCRLMGFMGRFRLSWAKAVLQGDTYSLIHFSLFQGFLKDSHEILMGFFGRLFDLSIGTFLGRLFQ